MLVVLMGIVTNGDNNSNNSSNDGAVVMITDKITAA